MCLIFNQVCEYSIQSVPFTYAKSLHSLVVADVIIAMTSGLKQTEAPDEYSPGYSLSESEMVVLCHEMEKCTELEVLDLTAIKIHRPAAEKLKQTMKALSSLVQLNLHCCRIRCEGITDLLTSTRLEVINLSGNKMQTLNMLPKCARLRCLDLTSCSLSVPGLLCKSLLSFYCSSLHELRLAKNTEIGDTAAGELKNVLAINVQLRVLDLMGCTLKGEALEKIFEGLTACILLNELNLTGNTQSAMTSAVS